MAIEMLVHNPDGSFVVDKVLNLGDKVELKYSWSRTHRKDVGYVYRVTQRCIQLDELEPGYLHASVEHNLNYKSPVDNDIRRFQKEDIERILEKE